MSYPLSPSSSSSPSPDEIQKAIHQFNRLLWTQIQSTPNEIDILLSKYPQLLSTPNKINFLPIHAAIKSTRSPYRSQIIKLIIEKGIEHDIGSSTSTSTGSTANSTTASTTSGTTSSRGGLLLHCKDKFSRSALALLVIGDDKTDILDYLQTRKPFPLFTSDDVIQYCLLHEAATDPSFNYNDRLVTFQYLMQLCPRALACRNENDDLPIHHLCKQTGYSIDSLTLYFNEMLNHGIELECDGNGKPFFQCCLDQHIVPLLESIQRDDVPILHVIIGVVDKKILRTIIDTLSIFEKWCFVQDGNGRLPIHVAAQCGLDWMDGMKDIVEANAGAISIVDPITGLYPFQMAAADSQDDIESIVGDGSCDLNVIFRLVRYNPSCVKRHFL